MLRRHDDAALPESRSKARRQVWGDTPANRDFSAVIGSPASRCLAAFSVIRFTAFSDFPG
jgi:hypothetical protein